jgi:osmotically-inducible protein OsmY
MSRWLLSALLALGLSAPAWADEPSNLAIFNGVSKQVQQYAFFTIFDAVHASIDNGVVTLTGKVTMPYKATDLAKRVAKVDGVTQVRNQIQVLPVSQFDNELRFRIARAIYRNSSLSMYGIGANPSIHIIVERGHVTLDGLVNNDMDRAIARMVAAQFDAFSVKNDLKTTEEVKQDLEKL